MHYSEDCKIMRYYYYNTISYIYNNVVPYQLIGCVVYIYIMSILHRYSLLLIYTDTIQYFTQIVFNTCYNCSIIVPQRDENWRISIWITQVLTAIYRSEGNLFITISAWVLPFVWMISQWSLCHGWDQWLLLQEEHHVAKQAHPQSLSVLWEMDLGSLN